VKLTTRLWLFGAAVPFAALAAASTAGALLFKRTLDRRLDDALLAQASIQAVALFDSPEGTPHLHFGSPSLEDTIQRVAAAAALYGPDGKVLFRHPAGQPSLTDDWLDLAAVRDAPTLATRMTPGGAPVRAVAVAVRGPSGVRYGLQLAASREPDNASLRTFGWITALFTIGVGAALALVQVFVGRTLTARIRGVSAQMEALREGRFVAAAHELQEDDEVGELFRTVGEAMKRLELARAAQGRLVAEAAHELRTPLGLMRTSIDLALRRKREAPELVVALKDTRREVDRLARLATRLLDLAAASRGEWDRAPGDLVTMVREAAEAIRAQAEEKAVVVLEDAIEPVPALFDANGVRQAVDNLLSNAVRFSPERGIVLITVSQAGGQARVSVHDDGPGIPPEERERVFEPFQRGADGHGAGAGLGLAIVREVARGHGGRAYVEGGDPGTTVVMELPVRGFAPT